MSSRTPIFSIIVPVYNSEKQLERCINSILSQRYQDFELLLINDGSSDTSGDICDRVAQEDSRIKVFHKANGGVSSARNVGLDNAKGEWIVFCDSDDFVLPEWLVNFAENIRQADLISQGIRFQQFSIDNVAKIVDVGISYEDDLHGYIDLMLEAGIVGYIFNKAFKKQIIKENNIKFDVRFNFREDEEFVLKYMTHCKRIISINSIGYYYIMPNFEQKYSVFNSPMLLYLSLYKSVNMIENGAKSKYCDWARNSVIDLFIKEFNGLNVSRQRTYLLEFRRLVGRNLLLSSKLFCISKYAIVYDPTGFVSCNILRLHHAVKKIK